MDEKTLPLFFFYFLANCGEPNDISRAILREGGTIEGSVRIYDCKPGTVTEGSNSIVCQSNGLWSRSDLYCRREFFLFDFFLIFEFYNLSFFN